MGEAKRRKELGLPPRSKRVQNTKTKKIINIWSKFSYSKLKSQYPAAPFVTTALVLLILQFGFSLNS